MPPKPRRLHPHLQNVVKQEALAGLTPTEIVRQLETEKAKAQLEKWGCAVPSLRSVQRIVASMAAKEPSVPWRLADADALEPEARRVVLDALAQLILRSKGRRTSLTVAEADWVARLHDVAPELGGWNLHVLAREYLARGKDSTADLDAVLAFRPWHDDASFDRYQRAFDAGWLGTLQLMWRPTQDVDGTWGWSIVDVATPSEDATAPGRQRFITAPHPIFFDADTPPEQATGQSNGGQQ